MKTICTLSLIVTAIAASAQSYSIDWFTIDGGGRTSTNAVYSLTGTIGQPDADGPMTGGNYALTGGFWALPSAVQATNLPALTIVASAPGQAAISWNPATPGFILEQSDSLTPANWIAAPSGAANPIIVPAAMAARFYRLRKP